MNLEAATEAEGKDCGLLAFSSRLAQPAFLQHPGHKPRSDTAYSEMAFPTPVKNQENAPQLEQPKKLAAKKSESVSTDIRTSKRPWSSLHSGTSPRVVACDPLTHLSVTVGED
ncbi:hypothetical protein STEG23_001617 [Scotinomys teguina]